MFAASMKYNELTGWTAADGLEQAAVKFGKKEAIVFDDQVYSFNDWNAKANQVARWAQKVGIKKGDVVAIYMENRPEYMFAWTGLAKIGAVGALINTNLRNKPFLHCLGVANAKHVLFGAELSEGIEGVLDKISDKELHVQGGSASFARSVDEDWNSGSKSNLPPSVRSGVGYEDACMYIYTSGTTGLPKAAIVKHAKLNGAGAAFSLQFGITGKDRIYNSGLPLYHSAANNIGGGVCLHTGATLVLRKKFSASRFWDEVANYNCTVVQYIGELCRYLLATPPGPSDKNHNARLAIGNGLRPDIWKEFQGRFGLAEVGEFYGATEGNVALFNHCTTPEGQGAVGHMGFIMKQLGLCTILRYDQDKQELVRDPRTGRCIEALPGEVGEACAEMKGRAAGSFDGYLGDSESSNKKLVKDVFSKGDVFFRTGDLLMRDALGYYFFIDRAGDTFRWKGENVATTEVSEICTSVQGCLESNVYGVEVPGKDGRACCVAVAPGNGPVDLDQLAEVCLKELPIHAVPVFVRLLSAQETTGTFKNQKVALRNEGMDITKITDEMYFFDASVKKYVPLTLELYNSIVTGAARL